MPDFARVKKALMLQGEPDRVPYMELGVEPEVKAAFLGKPINDLKTDVEFWTSAGFDYFPVTVGLRVLLHAPYTQKQEPSLVGEKAIPTASHTRLSASYSVYANAIRERSWAEEGVGLVRTLADAKAFPWPGARELDYSMLEQVKQVLPPGMKVIAILGFVVGSVWELMGQEHFYFSLHDDPELVNWMFQRVGRIQSEVADIVTQMDWVGALWMPDDIAYNRGLLVAPKYLRQYVWPWYERITSLCRQRDVACIHHSDGNVSEALDDIVALGFHAFHPIQPQAMDIVRVKRQVGHKLCLIGNIDLAYTLTRGTPEEVDAEVKLRISQLAPGGGYCVSSANGITEFVPLANFNALREAVFKYGQYPIKV